MLASFVNRSYVLFLIWRHNFLKLLLANTTVWKNYPKLVHCLAKHLRHKLGANSNWNHKGLMHNAVMCTLILYDVIGITRHLHFKLKSFSNIAQPLHNVLCLLKYTVLPLGQQGTKVFQFCTCPAGRVTYNFHSSCKHMHWSFKIVCNKENGGGGVQIWCFWSSLYHC